MTNGKISNLRALSDAGGRISALALDQRGSLVRALAGEGGTDPREVQPATLREFKREVTHALTPHATAILLEPEFGLEAAAARHSSCGLLLSYEASGYDKTRPGRLLQLMESQSAFRLARLGANALKLLIYYSPRDSAAVRDAKCVLVERVGAECEANGLCFFLEFLGYDPAGGDEKGVAFARERPRIVIAGMAEFSQPRYRVDVLKVETPVHPAFTEGMTGYRGERAYGYREALAFFKEASDASRVPFLYLSAGVDNDVFTGQLKTAAEAGAEFSGVLCGRATWKGGVPAYVEGGREGLARWLREEGARNLRNINEAMAGATPWWRKIGLDEPTE